MPDNTAKLREELSAIDVMVPDKQGNKTHIHITFSDLELDAVMGVVTHHLNATLEQIEGELPKSTHKPFAHPEFNAAYQQGFDQSTSKAKQILQSHRRGE